MPGDARTAPSAAGDAGRREPAVGPVALLALSAIAAIWLGYQGWRLLFQHGYWGAVDLRIYHELAGDWFGGRPVFVRRVAVHPPATLLAIWPFVGWLPFEAARWLWAGVLAATLALTAGSLRRGLGATTGRERLAATLLLLATYPAGASIGNGQVAIPLLAATFVLAETLERAPSRRRNLAAGALLLILLFKLSWGPPFFLAVLALPGALAAAALAAGGYLVATAIAVSVRGESVEALFRSWLELLRGQMSGTANLHAWLKDLGLEAWSLEASALVLTLFALWALRHRHASPAALFGVAAVVARLFTYHGWYDDLLLLVPLAVVLRAARAPRAERPPRRGGRPPPACARRPLRPAGAGEVDLRRGPGRPVAGDGRLLRRARRAGAGRGLGRGARRGMSGPARSSSAVAAIEASLLDLLDRERPAAGERWLVAFSGGPDSTALAAALAPLAVERALSLRLVHVDHGADRGSAGRARAAAGLARRLALPFDLVALSVPGERRKEESPESAARRLRYAALERARREARATRILTAHHRDDQVETVLLRILRGAPIELLGGIRGSRGPILRPLLAIPRSEIEAYLAERGIAPVRDPTNDEPGYQRNRIRHGLLQHLRAADEALLALAARATFHRRQLAGRLERLLADHRGSEVELLRGLPDALRPPTLRWLMRDRLGLEPLPSTPSLVLFLAGLERNGEPAPLSLPRAAGPRRALRARGGRLVVEAAAVDAGIRTPPFSYTFRIPGEVELPELGLTLRVRRSPVEPWMLLGDPRRAGFSAAGEWATVRNRRPGDRLRPLGSPGTRKLKEILVDRRVPADARDRLPLLELGGRIAWVPGVTVDEACRLGDGADRCWCAELVGPGEAREREGRKEPN
jgi:tRNA(Ile)-lysidine synthase